MPPRHFTPARDAALAEFRRGRFLMSRFLAPANARWPDIFPSGGGDFRDIYARRRLPYDFSMMAYVAAARDFRCLIRFRQRSHSPTREYLCD